MSKVVDKYQLKFSIIETLPGRRMATVMCEANALLASHLGGYFLNQDIDFLVEDVLPEINKAIAGYQFDGDAGGTLSFLTIFPEISQFSSLNEADKDVFVPTQDVSDIIIEWINWVNANDLKHSV